MNSFTWIHTYSRHNIYEYTRIVSNGKCILDQFGSSSIIQSNRRAMRATAHRKIIIQQKIELWLIGFNYTSIYSHSHLFHNNNNKRNAKISTKNLYLNRVSETRRSITLFVLPLHITFMAFKFGTHKIIFISVFYMFYMKYWLWAFHVGWKCRKISHEIIPGIIHKNVTLSVKIWWKREQQNEKKGAGPDKHTHTIFVVVVFYFFPHLWELFSFPFIPLKICE